MEKEIVLLDKEEFTITADGDAFISQTQVAKLCGVEQPAIARYIKKTGNTLKLNKLNQLSADSLELVIGHYAFDSQRPTEQAARTYRTLAKAGAKAYIYHLAGYEVNAAPKVPTTLAEALRLAADQAEKIEELEPKALVHDKLVETESLTDFLQTAKLLGIGRNTLLKKLRDAGVLMSESWNKNLPYESYMKRGLFEVKTNLWTDARGNEHLSNKTLVTGKGLTWLAERFNLEYTA